MSTVVLEMQLAGEVIALSMPSDYQELASKYPPMFVDDDSALFAHIEDTDARKGDADQWGHDLVQFFLTELRRQSVRYQKMLRDINSPGCRAVCLHGLVKLEINS